MTKLFDGKMSAKLGTEKNPAVATVPTEERLKEVESVFKAHGWSHSISVAPDKPEDISDLTILLNPVKTRVAEKKENRNDPCPCGSGKKYKKCCGK